MVVFATPKFCVTQACGPTLDRLKPIAGDYPDVTFIIPHLGSFSDDWRAQVGMIGLLINPDPYEGKARFPGMGDEIWFPLYEKCERVYAPSDSIIAELAEHGITNTELWSRGIDLARFSPGHRSAEAGGRVRARRPCGPSPTCGWRPGSCG